jgi:hypothetical protein
MTATPFGGRFVCTGRRTHPATAAEEPQGSYGPVESRTIRAVAAGLEKHPPGRSPATRFELRCPYVYPSGQPCGRTLRIGEQIYSRFLGVVEALARAVSGEPVQRGDVEQMLRGRGRVSRRARLGRTRSR